MSGFISGKEALIALANGEDVEYSSTENWCSLKYSNVHVKCILNDSYKFRLKPRTIALNGIDIEIPKELRVDHITGTVGLVYSDNDKAKQVVEALWSIFKC